MVHQTLRSEIDVFLAVTARYEHRPVTSYENCVNIDSGGGADEVANCCPMALCACGYGSANSCVWSHTYPNAHTDANSHRNRKADIHAKSCAYGDSYAAANCRVHGDNCADANSDPDSNSCSNAKPSGHSNAYGDAAQSDANAIRQRQSIAHRDALPDCVI